MIEDSIDEITERLSRTLTMAQNNRPSGSSNAPLGLNEIQKSEIRGMIRELVGTPQNSFLDEGSDQPIGSVSTSLDELDKVPDIVKSTREFSGRPGEFNSWKKSVDRVLELYESIKGTARYYAILHTIRTKITGDADTALESYRTPLNWNSIKKCLMMHYSDKRDIGTLEYQMTVLRQGNRTITEFYQAVYQHLSLILDKVSCLELDENSLKAMTNTYREKALDTFIRGLNGDLPRLLSVREPTSLPQALHICLKLDNMNFRMSHAHGQMSRTNTQRDRIGTTSFPSTSGRKFYPELAYIGGIMPTRPPLPPRLNTIPNFNSNYNANYNHGYRNPNVRASIHQSLGPKFQPNPESQNGHLNQNNQTQYPNYRKPPMGEPMDVDRSVQTGRVNYMNRPQVNQFPKRPAGTSFQGPVNKVQRNFHIETVPDERWDHADNYQVEAGASNEMGYDDPDYIGEYFEQIPESFTAEESQEIQPEDTQVAVHFLD